jgi:two-component system LytT family response regulator
MATAYIIDDEIRSGELLKSKIEDLTDYFHTIVSFTSPSAAYKAIIEHSPDIIFSDIEMPEMNGMELSERVKHLGIPTVYVTAFNGYSIKAIKQQVFDYILKPVKEAELLDTSNKFIAWKQIQTTNISASQPSFNEILIRQNSRILVHTAESVNLISIKSISHILGEDNYSRIFFENGTNLLSSKTLKHFENQLEQNGFIRVHKSNLVNMVFVDKLVTRDGGYLLLRSGEQIAFVRDKKTDILNWFKM